MKYIFIRSDDITADRLFGEQGAIAKSVRGTSLKEKYKNFFAELKNEKSMFVLVLFTERGKSISDALIDQANKKENASIKQNILTLCGLFTEQKKSTSNSHMKFYAPLVLTDLSQCAKDFMLSSQCQELGEASIMDSRAAIPVIKPKASSSPAVTLNTVTSLPSIAIPASSSVSVGSSSGSTVTLASTAVNSENVQTSSAATSSSGASSVAPFGSTAPAFTEDDIFGAEPVSVSGSSSSSSSSISEPTNKPKGISARSAFQIAETTEAEDFEELLNQALHGNFQAVEEFFRERNVNISVELKKLGSSKQANSLTKGILLQMLVKEHCKLENNAIDAWVAEYPFVRGKDGGVQRLFVLQSPKGKEREFQELHSKLKACEELISSLIKQGADIEQILSSSLFNKEDQSLSPLQYALMHNYFGLARFLAVECGANIGSSFAVVDEDGEHKYQSLLDYAQKTCDPDMQRFLGEITAKQRPVISAISSSVTSATTTTTSGLLQSTVVMFPPVRSAPVSVSNVLISTATAPKTQ